MTTAEEVRDNLAARWKLYLSLIVLVAVILAAVKTWADEKYDQSGDIKEIKKNVEYTLRLTLEDRIVELDNRIDRLSNLKERSSEQRQSLYEMRLKRTQLRQRLSDLDGNLTVAGDD